MGVSSRSLAAGSAGIKLSLLGGPVATLSALEFAADQSGTSLEAVEKASRGMARNLLAASNGSEAANQALSALGLTLEQLRALSPSEQFLLISDRLSKI